MRRLIWLPIAGFLLVAGAAIAAAAAAPSVTPMAQVNQDAASPAPSSAASPSTNNDQNGAPNAAGQPPYGFGFGFGKDVAGASADLLDQVLSDLVTAGTITQEQSDAITKALQQAITDKQTQAEQQRQEAMQEWQQIQGFLSDGVITQDEVNQLPADSPFRQVFDSIAKNGQVTLDQLEQLRMLGGPGIGPGMGGPGGHGPWGPGAPGNGNGNGYGDGQNPPASPSATGTSS
jgi:polyhydroxyalkanoate synthesis regulator phasin